MKTTAANLRGLRMATLCMALWGLGGCALAPGMHVNVRDDGGASKGYRVVKVDGSVVRDQRQREAERLAAARAVGLTQQDPAQSTREYRLGPGDTVAVLVWGQPELSNPYGERRAASDGIEIGPDGQLFFPYAGLLNVAGMTPREVARVLTQRLASVVRDPQVDVRVVSYRSQRVHVTGEVANPGAVVLDNTAKGVLEALGERGGLGERASRRHMYLSRGHERFEIDLAALFGGDSGSISPVLQAGDVIRVPDTADDQVMVLGAVEQPRALPIGADTFTAIAAVTDAGGVARSSARGSSLYVFRGPDREGDKIDVFHMDLAQPQGLLQATRFPLRPRDVVYVATTGLSKFNSVMQQLLPTLQEIFYVDRLTH